MLGTLPVAAQPSPPMEEDDELDDDEEWEYYSEEDELGIVPFVILPLKVCLLVFSQ